MNKIFVGTPTKYDQNDMDYVWALCKCPLPINYGIRIPKEKGIVDYHFKCKDCVYAMRAYYEEPCCNCSHVCENRFIRRNKK